MELIERLRELFANDRYATQQTGIVIDKVTDEGVTCSIALQSHHRNAKGAVMGGVLFTLADYAFAVAVHVDTVEGCDPQHDVQLHWVTSSSTIHYLAAAKGDRLTATTHCIKKGRLQAVFQISITDALGTPIALVTTTGTNTLH